MPFTPHPFRGSPLQCIVPYSMQTLCYEMPWCRTLRAAALILTIVLGLEWTAPLGGIAQSNPEPASTPPEKVANQDPQPMPETESAEAQSPVYKKWWFWVLVVVGVGVVFLVTVIAIAADEGGLGYQPVGGIGPASP